jgi:hypothetical protein
MNCKLNDSSIEKSERRLPPRLNREQKLRLQALLEMEYTPQQLADAIGCCRDTVYRGFVPAGCPHRRNKRGHIFINGAELSQWYEDNQPPKIKMAPDEAWCFGCNRPVKMQPPFEIKPSNRCLELVSCQCPHCGTTVNRARARRSKDD